MSRRAWVAAVFCAGIYGAVHAAVQSPAPSDASSMQKKLAAILGRATVPSGKAVRTSITEQELNAYLHYNGPAYLPKGIVDPRVTIEGDRRVTGRAMVNLDDVRTSQERSWLDPVAYLTGTVEVQGRGLLHTANGKGTFELESATVGGLPVPRSLLQEVVTYYSRTPESPEGFDLGRPFALPAKIRDVEIQRGAATIIQQ